MLRSDLCDYSDAYIVVKGKITVANPKNDVYDKKLAFKNNASFTSCILKANNFLIDVTDDLDVVMPLYNLLRHCKSYKKTTEFLLNYYKDEPDSGAEGNVNYFIKDSVF